MTTTTVTTDRLIEDPAEVSQEYQQVLAETMLIAADLELSTLPWAYEVFASCPDLGAKIATAAAIQDEMGHAHQMYMMLRDFGYRTEDTIFNRDPGSFRIFYMLQFPLRNYIELVVGQALLDRAGRVTTLDLEENCSYAPYRRALRKVNFEERFHVAHGERWTKYYWDLSEATREKVREYIKWLFPHGMSWFGVTDDRKKRSGQLTFRIRGRSNDEMRQVWLRELLEWANSAGIDIPAHYDSASGNVVADVSFPATCDPERRVWNEGSATWEETLAQWKQGAPGYRKCIERLQSEEWGESLWQS
ncbi:phenylacetate-CoA oxygenase subunit PaaI [Mycobacterium sp. SM1]|uniref:1,2-phenylacetyl-CoA epoxidase subunit PaaC n=1 Tax=Mycobacterium sp. SM1 TaxID=2816243 RepID=UPI001BD0CA0A|nr:Phenylacetic acid catabolic protein [Mycobacterium sp. SM1]MBS4730334.1 phenylacetate-CoA oxygenase subunit PaaI [Mycobacterium sp. SM1]